MTEENKAEKGRLGRRLAMGIYVVGLVYVIMVGFTSVIPQVFWPEQETDPSRLSDDCSTGLADLYMEVRRFAGELAAQPDAAPDIRAQRRFYKDWDKRLAAYATRCDPDACKALDRYRHKTELSLRRLQTEDRKLAEAVESSLAKLTAEQR